MWWGFDCGGVLDGGGDSSGSEGGIALGIGAGFIAHYESDGGCFFGNVWCSGSF